MSLIDQGIVLTTKEAIQYLRISKSTYLIRLRGRMMSIPVFFVGQIPPIEQ